jgi:hypothetical protein
LVCKPGSKRDGKKPEGKTCPKIMAVLENVEEAVQRVKRKEWLLA